MGTTVQLRSTRNGPTGAGRCKKAAHACLVGWGEALAPRVCQGEGTRSGCNEQGSREFGVERQHGGSGVEGDGCQQPWHRTQVEDLHQGLHHDPAVAHAVACCCHQIAPDVKRQHAARVSGQVGLYLDRFRTHKEVVT